MAANTNAEFEHIMNVIFGVDTPAQLLCIENGITNLRKFKVKFRNIRNLEYTDSTMNTKVKLSDDDFEELEAILPFKHHLQNELGPVTKYPVDITQYSREDFLLYYDNVYDVDNPTQYNQALAQAAEKHAEEMKILAAGTATSTRGLRKDYQERAYSHILAELLYAAENKESVLALKEYGITSLCELLELIRSPGSIIHLRYKDQNDDKDKKMLHEEQYRELLALYSYFNLAQIMYGPIANGVFNIFKTTRNDFKDFVDVYFDESNPIVYSEDGELLKQLSSDERWRVDTDINFGYDNSDSTLTPTACDNKWWQCHYFQPTALEIYDGAYNHELYWNEINWLPPDINTDDDYGNSYISRVLSQPMATIIKYHNNGFCDNGEYAACRI